MTTDTQLEAQRFRKKPVVIEAMQFDGSCASIDAICRWENRLEREPSDASEVVDEVDYTYQGGGDVLDPMCHTLEGPLRVSPGDWIIKGVAGEFYPYKPDSAGGGYWQPDIAWLLDLVERQDAELKQTQEWLAASEKLAFGFGKRRAPRFWDRVKALFS